VLPAKPVKSVSYHLLLRNHTGKAWFRGAGLQVVSGGAAVFDGMPVSVVRRLPRAFLVRDVAPGRISTLFGSGQPAEALGLELSATSTQRDGATFIEADLADLTGEDRAATSITRFAVDGDGWRWLANPRTAVEAAPPGEYLEATRFNVGATACCRGIHLRPSRAGRKDG